MSRVIWLIHAACPSRCAYCAIETQQTRRSLGRDEAVAVARDIVQSGFREVILVGGEPLLYPHLADVLEALRGRAEVAVFTGGIPGEPARSVELLRHGVRRVVFSVDVGLDAENDLVRGRKGITRDVERLAEAVHASLPEVGLSVNTVVSRANVRRLGTVWQRFERFGLDSWSLTLAGDNFGERPTGSFVPAPDLEELYLRTLPRMARALAGRTELVVLPVPLPFLARGVPIARWDVAAAECGEEVRRELERFSRGDHNASFVAQHGCPLAGRDLTIGVTGEIHPCSQAPILAPEHVVGHVREGLSAVLASATTRAFVEGIPHAPCRRCWAPSNVPRDQLRRLVAGSR
jgi:radical SAM protein with 4Fe4S-binding SPASM domain